MKYDFGGYVTRNDLKCSDGRIIRRDAFKDNDGSVVPLVYQHNHDDIKSVLGHALLENRADGVYGYCSLNDSELGQHAKILVQHGDISSLSIFANRLVQNGSDVMHGIIREVSLVLAGANPGAHIDNLSFEHSDGSSEKILDEATIYTGLPINTKISEIEHSDTEETEPEKETIEHQDKEEEVADSEEKGEKTVQDVIDSMTDEQRDVMYYIIGEALEGEDDTDEEGNDESMKQSVFDNTNDETMVSSEDLVHSIDMAKHSQSGSLRDALIATVGDDVVLEHSITNVDYLFPEARLVTPTPEMIARPNAWVAKVMGAVKKSPFARIKSTAANITEDEARAKGYIKGKQKKEEVIKLLRRSTTPQTVYKLQKMDRDDIIDITDFDVVAWLKAEMRMMLEEEIARALLVSDGRDSTSDDKINEEHIRPIYQDNDVYTIHKTVTYKADADTTDKSNTLIETALRARKDYKGSGNPVMYAPVDTINDLLLATDKLGRRLYNTMTELAAALRVSDIVEVPVMEGVERTTGEGASAKTYELLALFVNLSDYTIGADKGGEVNMFDDFDLNFNKYEYLIETRCSGALTKPYSAIALEMEKTTTSGGTQVNG